MKVVVREVVHEGVSLGVEFLVDGASFFQQHDESNLPGIRLGKMVPDIDQTFTYNVLYSGTPKREF